MHPHPNRLPHWLRRLLILSGLALLLTGLTWEALHWRAGFSNLELVLPHPWEAPLMRAHGLAMIGFLFALGGLGPVHVPRGWRELRNRKSGLLLIASAAALAGTGYALYYWTSETARPQVGWLHSGFGLLLALVFALHWRGRYPAKK